jgi:hypothetical protein
MKVGFDLSIYLTTKHLATQTTGDIYCFLLYRNSEESAAAVFQCVTTSGKTWISPPRASFGGIQCDQECTIGEINFLITCISEWITIQGGDTLIVRQSATCYNTKESNLVADCYLMNGFEMTDVYQNLSIKVTSLLYVNQISKAEKRRLSKCKSAGFKCELWLQPDVRTIYDFLNFCRTHKGYPLSMNLDQLAVLANTFPDEVMVFTVKEGEHIISLSVTVKVSRSVMYCFLSASLPSYSAYSPSVLLIHTLYDFCQKADISVLDLGTSLDHHGMEKAGLIRFKENMGGLRSSKVTFSKKFSF